MEVDFQTKFIEEILKKHNKKAEAVEQLSELLQVGKDAVYRRLRGDSVLTPDEISLLSKKYNISIDSLVFDKSDTVFFTYNAFSKKVTNFNQYLQGVLDNIESVNLLPNRSFDYGSMEIPVFHYFYNPKLTAFKLYIWGLTIWEFDFLKDKKFDFNIVSPDNFKITERIVKLYNQIPTRELYSLNILDTTLSHIEYIFTINGFKNPEDALLLCDEVMNIVKHSRSMAKEGMKFSPGTKPLEGISAPYDLYHNELVSTNNTFLVKSSVTKLLVTTFGSPNFLGSTDERMCNFTEKWLQNTISKSTSISAHSEKNRAWFFNRLEKKVKIVKNRIELTLEEI